MRSTLKPAISPASLVAVRWASLKYAGTVITASLIDSPRYASASRLSFISTRAEISCAVYFLPSMSMDQLVPISRLTDRIVRSGFVTAWRLATSPTRTSPLRANATIDGVVRDPSAFAMTVGSPPSNTLTHEFVVPRSIPTARAMVYSSRSSHIQDSRAAKVERTGLNSATRPPKVNLGLSRPGARSACQEPSEACRAPVKAGRARPNWHDTRIDRARCTCGRAGEPTDRSADRG